MEPQSEQPAPARVVSKISIIQDDISKPDVIALLEAHIGALQTINQANNQMGHLLDLSGLQQPSVTIFTARDAASNELMGCAALKQISPSHGELKSMRTVPDHRRKGVAEALLEKLMVEAKARGYQRLSLETGEQEDFAAARALYLRGGFVSCGPYEGYDNAVPVEGSVFMTYYIQ